MGKAESKAQKLAGKMSRQSRVIEKQKLEIERLEHHLADQKVKTQNRERQVQDVTGRVLQLQGLLRGHVNQSMGKLLDKSRSLPALKGDTRPPSQRAAPGAM